LTWQVAWAVTVTLNEEVRVAERAERHPKAVVRSPSATRYDVDFITMFSFGGRSP
jgi:hypothetical protein